MPAARLKIFLSSVQKEFEEHRKAIKNFLLGDAFLRKFIQSVFLFEDIPAKDRKADELYLEEVDACDIYIGIFGYEYGFKGENGISPTENEYIRASSLKKTRLIYVWGLEDDKRVPEMKALIKKASADLVRRRAADIRALISEVYSSLVDYLDERGMLRIPPFDATECDKSTLEDLSEDRIEWFLKTAQKERRYPLGAGTNAESFLIHLNLFSGRRPLNAAVLLFGKYPQRFLPTAELKCVHCNGTEYVRPFTQQIYKGDLFSQVDQARDFILSRLYRATGTRADANAATVFNEIPPDAVAEALINAVAHRDYYSKASVEIRLFSDRLEIWNPGTLPETMTLESLRVDHASIPNNPLIADPLYLSRYIEKAGSGTQMMIRVCRAARLPEPVFEERDGFFIVTLWRDWMTKEVLSKLDLNDRQRKAIDFLKQTRSINNSEYQKQFMVSKPTATRDLEALIQIGIVTKIGSTGKGTYYVLSAKGLRNGV